MLVSPITVPVAPAISLESNEPVTSLPEESVTSIGSVGDTVTSVPDSVPET